MLNGYGISRNTPGYEIRISQEDVDNALWSAADAFKLVLSEITERRMSSISTSATKNSDCTFSQLLDLAIACWQHGCFIRSEFKEFANNDRSCYDEQAIFLNPKTQQRSVDWMFIALVFDFPNIFEKKSVDVIMEYDPKINIIDEKSYHNLPGNFRELVIKIREEIVLETYNHIRDAWVSLAPQIALISELTRIRAHFNEPHLELDLTTPKPRRLCDINPDRLLTEFAKVLEEPEDGQPGPQEPARRSSIIGPGSRGGAASVAIFQGIRSAYASVKRHGFANPTNKPPVEDPALCQRRTNLLFKMNNWRSKNIMVGIPLGPGSKFSELRMKHIRSQNDPLPVLELGVNGIHL